MSDMQVWQWAVVAVAAIGFIGWMVRGVLGVFGKPGQRPAEDRRATEFESALVGGTRPADVAAYDAFSYRVGARFAGKVRVVVASDRVVVSGPRVPRPVYRMWIWAQALPLACVPLFLVWAVVAMAWTPLLWALGAAVVSWTISILGAGLWPGLGEMELLTGGAYKALEFPLSSVRDVAIGEGWARGGMDVVLFPYKKGIDAMAGVQAVSFYAPDEVGREVRFAVHLLEAEDASALARLLRGDAG